MPSRSMAARRLYLVLCDDTDADAIWACSQLAIRLPDVQLVLASQLSTARIEYWSGTGGVGWTLHLLDGRVLHSRDVLGGLNTLVDVPNGHLWQAVEADRDYALQE